METIRFDAHFGTVIERPWSAEALRREAEPLLAGPDAWTWLAEHDGEPRPLDAEPPEAASWIAPMAGPDPVAYLELMYVQPGERGQGMAPALVELLHREADAAGVAVTLLHYEQVNPLSGPFWNRQGYRPLRTSWEARPARYAALTAAPPSRGHPAARYPAARPPRVTRPPALQGWTPPPPLAGRVSAAGRARSPAGSGRTATGDEPRDQHHDARR